MIDAARLPKGLQRLLREEDGMADWTRALLADSAWSRTVERKDSVVRDLDEELERYQRDFGRASTAERDHLYPDAAYRRDAALSSTCTLVYRGITGTMTTAVAAGHGERREGR